MNEELYHYGVKGMRWGVRKYQNDDGSLTEKGEKRFAKVKGNSRLAGRQTKQAVKILQKKKQEIDAATDLSIGSANTANKKFGKYYDKATAKKNKGNIKGYDKYMHKVGQQWDKIVDARKSIDYLKNQSAMLSKKINDISSGKKKAGKDFIVHNQYRFMALPMPGGMLGNVGKTSTLIERNKRR